MRIPKFLSLLLVLLLGLVGAALGLLFAALCFVPMAVRVASDGSDDGFHLAGILLLIFSVWLDWLPVLGASRSGDLLDEFKRMILPTVALAFAVFEARRTSLPLASGSLRHRREAGSSGLVGRSRCSR